MATVTTRPSETVSLGEDAVVTGAATAHQALNDDSDSSHVANSTHADSTRFKIPDPSVPSGAMIKDVRLRIRERQNGGTLERAIGMRDAPHGIYANALSPNQRTVSSTSFQTVSTDWALWSQFPHDDEYLEALFQKQTFAGGTYIVSEFYVDFRYVPKPELTVDSPDGLIINNRPTVTWTPDLDSDGGAQTNFQVIVKTFPGGTVVYNSGVRGGSANEWEIPDPLDDGNYTVEVLIAQRPDWFLPPHWSDAESSLFEVDASSPATPTLTVTAEDSEGRIKVDIEENTGDADTDQFELQVSNSGDPGTWELSRSILDGVIDNPNPGSNGSVTIYDYDSANGVTRYYRTRAIRNHGLGLIVNSDWSGTESDKWEDISSWWFKHPTNPSKSLKFHRSKIWSNPVRRRPARQGIHHVLDRPTPVIVTSTRQANEGELVVMIDNESIRDKWEELLLVIPVLVQAPANHNWQGYWVVFGDLESSPMVDKTRVMDSLDSVSWHEVDPTTEPLES